MTQPPPEPSANPFEGDEARKQREREKAAVWLTTKWTRPHNCPICEADNWTVTEAIEVRGFQGGNLVIGGSAGLYPLFQVICNNCGHTHLFNAVMAGVVTNEDPQ